jgi:hypothetical protein
MTDVDQTAVWDGSSWVVLAPIAGGRNRIINGDFKIWQRGSSLSVSGGAVNYIADRFYTYIDGNGTATVSRQAFTPGSAPTTGYESQYFHRIAMNTIGTTTVCQVGQRVEDVRTLSGQTVTISFWAKADSARTINLYTTQYFGTGGSSGVTTSPVALSVTTGWQRLSSTITLGSMSGKTIGDGSYIQVFVQPSVTAGFSLDTWGWQFEAGAVATPFEVEDHGTTLAKCHRYAYRSGSQTGIYEIHGLGLGQSGTRVDLQVVMPVVMRTTPTITQTGNIQISDTGFAAITTSITIDSNGTGTRIAHLLCSVSSGVTQYRTYRLENANNTTANILFSAEL